MSLRESGFLTPLLPLPRDGGSSDDNSGSWSDVDLALALPPDPDPNPAGRGPGSAAPVLRDAPEALLQPARGSPFAGDDWEKEDGWVAGLDEEHAPHQSDANRFKRPCDGGLVSKGKRPRVEQCCGNGGGGGDGDEAALPGAGALGRSHQATPGQARHHPSFYSNQQACALPVHLTYKGNNCFLTESLLLRACCTLKERNFTSFQKLLMHDPCLMITAPFEALLLPHSIFEAGYRARGL